MAKKGRRCFNWYTTDAVVEKLKELAANCGVSPSVWADERVIVEHSKMKDKEKK